MEFFRAIWLFVSTTASAFILLVLLIVFLMGTAALGVFLIELLGLSPLIPQMFIAVSIIAIIWGLIKVVGEYI